MSARYLSPNLLLLILLFVFLPACKTMSPPAPDTHGSLGSRRCSGSASLTDEEVARSAGFSVEKLTRLKAARSLSNADVCTMPDAALKRALARLERPKADHPGEWAKFRTLQRRSEDGTVKPDGLIRAIEERKALLDEAAAKAAQGDFQIAAAGISSEQWTALGPGNIGGRIRAILIEPSNTNRLWLGSVSGGIWNSTDAGASWHPVDDFMGNLSVSSLVMPPGNPNVLYAGTGEGFYNLDAVRGAGIFKSTDAGVTWTQIPATDPAANPDWYYVNRLAIHPANANVLLAATNGGIYRSSDGGSSWAKVDANRALDVRFDPNNGNNAVGGGNYGKVLRSADGGLTWSAATLGPSDWLNRIEVAYAASAPGTVFASVNASNGQLWRSANGGATWSLVSTPQHLGSQGWYDNAIWVDPTNASHLIIGGIDLWRSTNGGLSWTRISNWINNMYNGYRDVPHADHHVIVADPNYNGSTNRRIYSGNDGGIFRSPDISAASETTGWETLNQGLAITQFYSGAGKTAAGGKVIGGTQDNGSLLSSPPGTDWQMFFGGDGGYSAVDSLDDNYLYGEYVYLQLHRSTNGGASEAAWIYDGIADAGANANFIAPFILDPNDNNRMLAGGASLWQSLDVKAPVPQWTPLMPAAAAYISAIAIAPWDSNVVWVGTNDGELYLSGNTLSEFPDWFPVNNGLPTRMVTRILPDPEYLNTTYVAFGGYNSDNLYVTVDGGVTWENITGNLPAVPIFTIARHPMNANWLYAGTEVGVFTTQDGGATWYTTNDGPANVEISELFWLDDNTLVAATHGRGMFRVPVGNGFDNAPPAVAQTTPANGATAVAVGAPISVRFNEPMDPATIKSNTFTVNNGVSGTVTYNGGAMTATFTPSLPLAYNTSYTATITTGVTDLVGNALAAPFTWSFTTGAPPPLDESFASGAPAGWTILDNTNPATGKVWRFDNPAARTNLTGGSGAFAIIDSDNAGSAQIDSELRSPLLDLSSYASVTLGFKTDFYFYGADNIQEVADVDISVNGDAGPWTNVWRKTANYRGPKSEQIDISTLAAGKANVKIRFHYYNARYDWFWQVDDVLVQGTPASARLLAPAATPYATIQAAYDNAANGNTIQTQAITFNENLSFANPVAVFLKGGFDAAYTSNNGGYSILNGKLTVRGGTVNIENFRLR